MKINRKQLVRRQGFTLIEMVGVLAVIAILAALLLPKIFAAMRESQFNNAVESYNNVKTAAMGYFGKNARFAGNGGAALEAGEGDSWDEKVLLVDGFIEKAFSTKLGEEVGTAVHAVKLQSTGATGTATLPAAATFTDVGLPLVANATVVVWAEIPNVSLDDAEDLDRRIDGNATATAATGRCVYDSVAGTPGTVYLYIAHK